MLHDSAETTDKYSIYFCFIFSFLFFDSSPMVCILVHILHARIYITRKSFFKYDFM